MSRKPIVRVVRKPGRDGWWLRWSEPGGKRRWQRVHGDAKQRAAARDEKQRDVDDAFARAAAADGDPLQPFATFADAVYLPLYENTVAPATLERTLEAICRAGAFWGERPIHEISRTEAKRFVEHLRGLGLAEATIRRLVASVAPIFDEAEDLGLVAKNPFRGPKRRRPKIGGYVPRRVVPLDPDLDAQILALASDRYRLPLLMSLDTGWRAGQVLGAKWSDQVEDLAFLRAPFEQKGGIVPVCVPTPRLRDALLAIQVGATTDEIFPGLVVNAYSQAWRTIRGKIGREDLHLHDFRHVLSWRLKAGGVSSQVIAALLGHRSPRMATHVYGTEVSQESLQDAARRLAAGLR